MAPPPIERKSIDLTPLKNAKVPIVFIIGGPGSGKGTQCELIVREFGYTHLSSGDLLRAEVNSGSAFGKQLKQTMDAGQLVPLETVLDLIKAAMVKACSKNTKGFLIDGYPRDVRQGKQFESEIQSPALVLFLDVKEETLVARLMKRGETSGRSDDNLETIKKRLRTFVEETKPVVEYYTQKRQLITIQAEMSIEDVFKIVRKYMEGIGNNSLLENTIR